MEAPPITEHHRKLGQLAGSWVGDEKVHDSPLGPGCTAKGRYVNRIALDGRILVLDYEQEMGGQITYAGHGIYGWHPQREAYTMYWADLMSGAPDLVVFGQWDGDGLIYTCDTGPNQTRYTIDVSGEDTFGFLLELKPAEAPDWLPFLEGNYRRV